MGKFVLLLIIVVCCQHASAFTCKRKLFGFKETFTCPESGNPSSHIYCCGDDDDGQWCCDTPFFSDTVRSLSSGLGKILGIIAGIIGFFIILCIVLCCLCPCCILYKRRQRGGVVYRSVVTNPTGGQTINVTVAGPPPNPGMNPATPGFIVPGGNPSGPGYPPQPGFAPQPGYPPQPGYSPQMNYPLNSGNPQPTGYPYAPGPVPMNDQPPPYPATQETYQKQAPYNPNYP